MKIAIIGAGACGLASAALLSDQHDVYVFEANEKPGRKILASGNGKANISNEKMHASFYNHPEFVNEIYQQIPKIEVQKFFKNLGLYLTTDEEGRMYPFGLSSQAVLDILLANCPKVTFFYNHPVTEMKYNGHWKVNDCRILFDHIIVASGSIAGIMPKKQKHIYSYLKDFPLTRLKPALCGFRILNPLTDLTGLRVKANCKLIRNGKELYQEFGEVMFKEDGISGIVIMNLEAIYTEDDSEACYEIIMDLLPHIDPLTLVSYPLEGIFHPKLAKYLQKNHKTEALNKAKEFRLAIIGTYDFPDCQVVNGGISLNEVTPNLTSKNNETLHFGGEVLDVIGRCGGYNLHFAFACALLHKKVINNGS